MLIEIEGERTGSITLFGSVAIELLKMMGQSGQPDGAIREADVPEALKNLNQALKVLPTSAEDDQDTDEPLPVSLHTRANPLIRLLEESIAKGGYVMWKAQK